MHSLVCLCELVERLVRRRLQKEEECLRRGFEGLCTKRTKMTYPDTVVVVPRLRYPGGVVRVSKQPRCRV